MKQDNKIIEPFSSAEQKPSRKNDIVKEVLKEVLTYYFRDFIERVDWEEEVKRYLLKNDNPTFRNLATRSILLTLKLQREEFEKILNEELDEDNINVLKKKGFHYEPHLPSLKAKIKQKIKEQK